MVCFTWIILIGGFIFVMVTLLRWFEQITDAVDQRSWNKVALFMLMPFAVWLFPSRLSAGRTTAFPLHEPVRGFGEKPSRPLPRDPEPQEDIPLANLADQPPPGTPKEFLGLPPIPPRKPKSRPPVDPEQIEKLRQKMREQGMLPPEE